MDLTKKLEGNIRKFYIYRFFQAMFLVGPIFVLFLTDNGLSITQVMFLQAYFYIILLLLEVPSGAFADRYGRKLSIILSSLFVFIGHLTYALGYSFAVFMIAETIYGIAVSLWSGTDSAFLYDTLKNLKREKEFKKVFGNYIAINLIFLGLGGILGGYLAEYDLRLPFWISLIPLGIAFFIPFSFTEPRIYKKVETNYWQHIKKAINYSLMHKKLRFFLIYSFLIVGISEAIGYLFQPYFIEIGINVIYFGIVFFVGSLMAAIGAKYANKIEIRLGERKTLFFISLIAGTGYLVMGKYFLIPISLIAFFFASFAFGGFQPVIEDYYNRHVKSFNRATVVSFKNFLNEISFVIFAPLLGVITDTYSLGIAFITSGILILINIVFLIIMYFIRK